MKKTVVLGIGNRLMEDDGIGNEIVEELRRRDVFPGLRLIAGETDTDYCLDEMEGADHVILTDAANMGTEPCSVTVLPLRDIIRELPSSSSAHHFDLLHGMKQRNYKGDGILLAVEACSIRYHLGMSPQMKAQFPRIVDEIEKYIENYLDL
jgi:hydrogenase maturation protease